MTRVHQLLEALTLLLLLCNADTFCSAAALNYRPRVIKGREYVVCKLAIFPQVLSVASGGVDLEMRWRRSMVARLPAG
jgi:hypothetical protein